MRTEMLLKAQMLVRTNTETLTFPIPPSLPPPPRGDVLILHSDAFAFLHTPPTSCVGPQTRPHLF